MYLKRTLVIAVLLCVTVLIVFSQKTSDSIQSEKKASFAGVPKLSYNRSSGFGFGAMGMMLFKLDDDPATPKSNVMVTGTYTTNKSWNIMGMFQLYMVKDLLRVTTGGGYLNFNFQTYYNDGTMDIEVPYVNSGGFFFVNPLIKAFPHFYIGPTLSLMRTKVNFDMPDGSTTEQAYDLNSLGVAANYDTRSNVYYPISGLNGMLNFTGNPSWFKNDSIFSRIMFNINYYYPINPKMVLASRFATKISLGNNVPFVGENVVGGKDIRGYTKGNYRGDQVYSIQSELRWMFYKRLGIVAFFGLALEIDKNHTVSPLLPGGGAGIRFMLLPKDKLTIGVDGAVGRDDWGMYFRIGEAF